MTKSQFARSKLLLAAACMVCLLTAHPSVAGATDATTEAARNDGDVEANSHDIVQGAHVEGHIAFLKAELAITPAQEPLWEVVAAAMREDVRNMQEAESRVSHKRRLDNAIDYLENRASFAALRAQGETRFLTAFQPLYNNLSDHQKQVADGLLMPNLSE